MPPTDERDPRAWLQFAAADLEIVDLALRHDLGNAAVLAKLLEALEKTLKAYLVSRGWPLRRIHDVEALLQEAAGYDSALQEFVPVVEPLAEAYFEGRYPGFEPDETSLPELRQIRADLEPLLQRLRTAAGS